MQGQSKILGPYEVINEIGPVGRVLETLPFTKVRGSQIIIFVNDNFAGKAVGSGFPTYMAAAEVEIIGTVQAVEFVLKRQFCKAVTGPMFYIVPDEEAYDNILIRARNLSGGRRGPPGPEPGGPALAPTAANGFSIKVQGQIQPRGGLGPKNQWKGMG